MNTLQDLAQVSVPDVSITEHISPAELKQCSKCKEYKTLDFFHNDKSRKDGKHPYCKSCNSARARAYYNANPEKVAAKNREWNEANPEKAAARKRAYYAANTEQCMLNSAKGRAKENNLDFNLTIEDTQIPERCPILGILLERGNTRANKDSSPSLDKILPEKGYVKGNVQVISDLANRMKSNATFAQMVAFANWVKRQELLGTAA
jgi:hypothetical protein